MKKTRSMVVLVILIVGLIFCSPDILGVDGGLEISPPMKDLLVNPGVEQSFNISLNNSSNQRTLNIRIWLSPIEQKTDGSYSLIKENDSLSAASWLEIKQESVSIPPNNEVTVTVKMKVPRNAFGSRAAAIIYDVIPDDKRVSSEGIGGSTTFVHRLTTIIKITVNSRANRKQASINGLSVVDSISDNRFATYGKKAVAVICAISNDGNVLFAERGYIIIRNTAGRRVKEAPLGAGRGIILPGAKVELVSIFPDGLPDGDYTVETTIPFGGARPLMAKIPFTISRKAIQKGDSLILNTVSLNVSPERFETQLPGGAFRTFSLTMVNDEKAPLKVKSMIKDVTTGPDGELTPSDESIPLYSAIPWLKLDQTDFVLAPGEKKIFQVIAEIPKEATGGTRYASLVFEAGYAQADKPGTVTSISTPIVISTGKNMEHKATISDLQVFKDKSGVWIISSTLLNQGNTHFTTSGKVILSYRNSKPEKTNGLEVLTEAKWEELITIPLVESPGWLLPGDNRLVFAAYEKELKIGEYQAEIFVDIGEKTPLNSSCIFKLAAK